MAHVMAGDDPPIRRLLEFLGSRPAWMADAACIEHRELSWFPERGQDVRAVKAVCDGCLVNAECRAYADEAGRDLHGIWGGASARQRRRQREAVWHEDQVDVRRALTGEQAAEIVAARQAGATMVDLARRYNVSIDTIRRYLRAAA